MIGHNRPSFDAVVEENLRRGLYLTQRDVLANCIRDPRLSDRHRIVLAGVIEYMNARTGVAYPGRRALAESLVWYDHEYNVRRYTEGTVATTISELIAFGYLMVERRAPEGGGRAMAHYTVVKPSVDELQRQISSYIEEIRGRPRAPFALKRQADVNPAVNVSGMADINNGVNVRAADGDHGVDVKAGVNVNDGVVVNRPDVNGGIDVNKDDVNSGVNVNPGLNVNPVIGADVNPVMGTVTSIGTGSKNSPHNPPAQGSLLPPEGGRRAAASAASAAALDAFEQFWAAFPDGRKRDKGDCRDLFVKIVTGRHRKRRATADVLIAAARRYRASRPDPDYVPMPSTWLNGGRWEDDLPEPKGSSVDDEMRRRLEQELERELSLARVFDLGGEPC